MSAIQHATAGAVEVLEPIHEPKPGPKKAAQFGDSTTLKLVTAWSSNGAGTSIKADGTDGAQHATGYPVPEMRRQTNTAKSTQEILDWIECEILEESERNPGTGTIRLHYEDLRTLLAARPSWPMPADAYAGSEWEIALSWTGQKGRFEITTEPDRCLSYLLRLWCETKAETGTLDPNDPDIRERCDLLLMRAGVT